MLTEISQNLFSSLLTELFVLLIAIAVRGDKPKMAKILGFGTLLAGLMGFGPTIWKIINSPTSTPTPTTSQIIQTPTAYSQIPATTIQLLSGLGTFTFGQYDFDESDCAFKDNTNKVNRLELWQGLFVGFAIPYQPSDVGNTIYWTVYSPDGSKLYDNYVAVLDDSLCNLTYIEMNKQTSPGQYHLLVTYQGDLVFEKYFQVDDYDLSEVILPTRPNFGTGVQLGRSGANTYECKLAVEIYSFSAVDFSTDEWVYYIAPYRESDVGNSYKYQVYDPNMFLLHDVEKTLADTYQHCSWSGFSLGSDPNKGIYLFRILYSGKEIYKKNFWIK